MESPTIDFGTVARGSSHQRTFTVTNTGDVARAVAMTFASNSSNRIAVEPSGTVTLEPNATQTFTLTLDTTNSGPATATLPLKRDSSCSSDVTIAAVVVDALLTCAPPQLNFGYVPPSLTGTGQLTCSNAGSAPIAISNVKLSEQGQTTASTIFTYAGAATVVVPAQGSAALELAFKPTALGPRQGLFTFDTDAFGQPTVSLPLRGVGGGPKIDVAPTLTLPPSAVGSSQRGVFVVRNVGVRPNPADPAGNLRIESLRTRALANTTFDEVLVDFPPTYDRTAGIEGGQSVNFDVTFTPQTAGTKSIELSIHSNDVSAPVVTVVVTMEAIAVAPCTYTVTPAAIDFGTPRPGAVVDWPVTVTNTGTTSCTVLEARVAPAQQFAVPDFTGGPLAPGAANRFHVRYTQGSPPAGLPPPAGTLTISTNSSSTPTTSVPLSASTRATCILTPSQVDFGSAPAACRSAAFNVPVLNTCSTATTVSNATVVTGSGGSTTEFTATASTGASLGANTGLTFTVDYRPADLGADEAFLTFTTTENLGTFRHVIPLRGVGVSGTVTETFSARAPRLDVLLAIDDSPSMVDAQTSLAMAGASLGFSNAVDVRFGVTTADLASTARGVLRRTGSNAPFVANSTPNASAEFATLVGLGGTGAASSCLAAAAEALSDARLHGSNFGFLRNDAHLGVICLTDSPDSTPNPVSFELDRLSLVRGLQRADAFSYSVVGPFLPTPPGGCTYDGSNTATHATAITRFSGVEEEICSGNAGASIGNVISQLVARVERNFTLARPPDLATTPIVTINGAPVPSTVNGMPAWSIDSVTGRLTFSALYAPAPGLPVTISYAPLCY